MGKAVAAFLMLTMSLWTVAMAQDRRSDEDHVRSLDDQERIAALKRDIPALERLWSEEFIVNAPNNQVVVGRRAVLETFVRAGVINFSIFELFPISDSKLIIWLEVESSLNRISPNLINSLGS